jgi:hypothetical protein
MAITTNTFSDLGGAVQDIFAGYAAETQANLKAQGLSLQAFGERAQTDLQARGLDISAAGIRTQAQGLRIKAQGDIAEGQEYDLAAAFPRQNVAYTERSTAIQSMQLDRDITATIGGVRADVAASGLKESGSAIYLLADSARQGALAHQVLSEQGAITEAGYQEQAQSYDVMSAAARMAAGGETSIADATDAIAGQTEELGVQTRAVGQAVAAQTDVLAQATIAAGQQQKQGDFVGALIKGAAGVASLALAL